MSVISRKICLVGDFAVGKTSLIRRFVEREFSDQYLSTVGVKLSRKTIEARDGAALDAPSLQLIIWDIEGNNRFKAIAPTYLQGAKGAILVGDVTRPETLENLSQHIQLFLSINPNQPIAIAFNKVDLVTSETLMELLRSHSFSQYTEVVSVASTSAKTGDNVDALFQTVAQRLID